MRLIDADELIKVIKDRAGYSSATAFVRNMQKLSPVQVFKHIMKLIEQAPTVELTASFMRQQAEDELIRVRAEADQRGYTRGYQYGFYSGQHMKRPKGEWIFHTYMPHKPYCNKCERNSPYGRLWDYCPNCGAKMKGAEE